MRELKQARHGHLIHSQNDDASGLESHTVSELGPDNPETLFRAAKANDREFSQQLKKHQDGGRTIQWEPVATVGTLAQALKVAKTRRMLTELSAEERREIMRAIYPLVSEDSETDTDE